MRRAIWKNDLVELFDISSANTSTRISQRKDVLVEDRLFFELQKEEIKCIQMLQQKRQEVEKELKRGSKNTKIKFSLFSKK